MKIKNSLLFILGLFAYPFCMYTMEQSPRDLSEQLRHAISAKKADRVLGLLKEGANPNEILGKECNKIGKTHLQTHLISAAAIGCVEICKILLDHGAKVDQTDSKKWTALHFAANDGNLEVCSLLLERHASIAQPEKTGKNPLDIAAYAGHEQVVNLFLMHYAVIEYEKHKENIKKRLESGEASDEVIAGVRTQIKDVLKPLLIQAHKSAQMARLKSILDQANPEHDFGSKIEQYIKKDLGLTQNPIVTPNEISKEEWEHTVDEDTSETRNQKKTCMLQ